MDNKEKIVGKFANFMNKASDFGKKTAAEVQKGAKELGAQTQKTIYEQRLKYYNPLFREKFFSDDFALPNVIQIVDDAVRRGIDVCEGAIGWTQKIEGVEVLFIYDEFVEESKINFVPFIKCDKIYCIDVFEKGRYISSDTIFDSAMNEKMAELEHIAYCLGAKSCSIEMIEQDVSVVENKINANVNIKELALNAEHGDFVERKSYQGGKNITCFEGNRTPKKPKLKWFAYDENIKNLIKMRCSGNNEIKHKQLSFKGSASATMSQKSAIAIDALQKVKGNAALQKRAIQEHSTLMVLDVEF